MSTQFFSIIKEISSLDIKLANLNSLQGDDKKRVERLYEHKERRKEDLTQYNKDFLNLKSRLLNIETKVSSLDKAIEKAKYQLSSCFNEDSSSKIQETLKSYTDEIDTLQEEGLTLLDKEESLLKKINDAQGFLKGIDSTIDEITNEAMADVSDKEVSKDHLKERKAYLLETLTSTQRESYQKILKNAPTHRPISKIVNNRCGECLYAIPVHIVDEIDLKNKLCACEMCQRLLII